jgi:hypothetical protein
VVQGAVVQGPKPYTLHSHGLPGLLSPSPPPPPQVISPDGTIRVQDHRHTSGVTPPGTPAPGGERRGGAGAGGGLFRLSWVLSCSPLRKTGVGNPHLPACA